MKKLLISLIVCLLFSSIAIAEPAEVLCDKFYPEDGASGLIALDTSVNTKVLTLVRKSGYEGFFSIQPIFTGSGVLKIDYQTSNDIRTGASKVWNTAVEIIATAVSGTIYAYPVSGVNIFAGYQRFVLTETGAANSVTVTSLNLCRQ